MNECKKWRCVSNCGACCHLDPTERPDLDKYLTPEELELYLSMVGKDGWCINFDRQTRKCQIYEHRPRFCRVKPEIFEEMYQMKSREFDEFAIACCHQQISGVYGRNSRELKRYRAEVADLGIMQ
ncbi:YkgJ family cysteine cluster protein [Myxosarcina sp. GI1(2024)]